MCYSARRPLRYSVNEVTPAALLDRKVDVAHKLPKVRRRSGSSKAVTAVLGGAALLLVVVIGYLLSSGDLFSNEPRTDAERDYQLLLEGVKKNPRDPAVLMTLAEAEWKLGKKSEAIDHGRRAVDNAAARPGFRLRLAGLLLLDDQRKEARRFIDDEIALKTPGDPEPYFLRAQLNRVEKKYDDALADMKKALTMSPTSADMIILYADILAEAGEKEAAIDQYRSALRYLPGDARAVKGLEALGEKAPPSSETTAHGGTGQ